MRGFILIMAIVVVAIECLVWLFAGALEWSARNVMVGAGSPPAAANARFALEIFAAAGLNIIGLIGFLVLNRQRSWWLLTGLQLADLAVTVSAGVLLRPGWWILSALAALALVLLYLSRPTTRPHFVRSRDHLDECRNSIRAHE
jgi:hypothetical protein